MKKVCNLTNYDKITSHFVHLLTTYFIYRLAFSLIKTQISNVAKPF